MGIKFIEMDDDILSTSTGNIRNCIFFATGGLLLSTAQDITVDVGPRRDKRNSIQVYVSASFGAVRMWEEKVIRVKCDEDFI